jgi:hypothetical protein
MKERIKKMKHPSYTRKYKPVYYILWGFIILNVLALIAVLIGAVPQ